MSGLSRAQPLLIVVLLIAAPPRCLLALCTPAGQEAIRKCPQAIRALQESRRSIVSGTIAWSREDHQQLPGRRFQFVSRMALNGDMVVKHLGDQDGWVRWGGAPLAPYSRFPEFYLQNADGLWHHPDASIAADIWRRGDAGQERNPPPDVAEHPDIRMLGVHPLSRAGFESGTNAQWGVHLDSKSPAGTEPSEWQERISGTQHEVTLRQSNGTQLVWTIDAARGWNSVSARLVDGAGKVRAECKSELRELAGMWLPAQVTYYRDGALVETYTIDDAVINAPDDPASLGGRDIGLEPGFNVTPQNLREEGGVGVMFWDGDRVVTLADWKKARAAGAQPGPTIMARRRGEHSPFMTAEQLKNWETHHREMAFRSTQNKPISLWEQYVRDFCERFKLNDEQRQKAFQILKECQGHGQEYLNRRKTDFYKAQDEIGVARKASDNDKLRATNERLAELRRPIDDIFEKQLKPRVDKLPTRQQRDDEAKRAAAATTQPAAKP
ncbi:MAG: hypothetical protein CHACPFDD_03507 [Phycisphaerae bacterium]|nr:hypothetical protein [Phycisphaerae bacterium]